MMRPILPSLVVAAILAIPGLWGCAEPPGPSNYTVRDSAGIRIVESGEPAWGPGDGWSIAPDPVMRIGEREGEESQLLFQVADARRLPGGGIAVLNGGSGTVRIFAGDGDSLREFGGAGEGPEEFRSPISLHVLAEDTLLIWDGARPGFSLFTVDGEFLRSRRLSLPGLERPAGVHPLPGSRLLLTTHSSPFTRPGDHGVGIHRFSTPFLVLDGGGMVLDTLGFFPSGETMILEQAVGVPPFHKSTYVDVRGDAIYVGTADAMEVSVRELSGEPKAFYRYPAVDLTVGTAEREWFRDRMGAEARPEEVPILEQISSSLIFPETRAAYTDLQVDPTGAVWLRTGLYFPEGPAPTEWSVFSREGAFLGTLAMPPGFEPMEFGRDFVLGRWKDELGVEQVRVYRIENR